MNTLIIRHADCFTSNGILPDAVLIADDGVITHIGPFDPNFSYPAGEILEAGGLLVSPGWIDIQINGGFGLDFTQEPESIWEFARHMPQYGVTAFLPTIITSPLEIPRRAIKAWKGGAPMRWQGAIPLGLHLEGPFLNPGKKGAHNPDYLRSPDLSLIPEWRAENGVRLVTLAPELPGAYEMIAELRHRGIVVSAGHSQATYEQAITAFQAGISCATHLYNAMPPLDHRSPGLVGALLTQPQIPAGLIADGIHSHPAMIQLAWKSKGAGGIILVTDAMTALGMPPGEYRLADTTVYVDETSARLANGGLAGSILTLPEAVQNVMKFCNVPLADVLPSVTHTPARLLGLSKKGWLATGCNADLTLLNPQGEVTATIIGGRIVYSNS